MIGRIAYLVLFSAALPALLVAWAIRLDQILALPAHGSVAQGFALALAGVAMMAEATRELWFRGGGLPASPYPPKRLVTSGLYAVVAHPIYLGAVMTAFGVSLATRSASGLWIVSPVLALCAIAFVVGFEREATFKRYGGLPEPVVRLPRDTDAAPTPGEQWGVYLRVFLPWLLLYKAVEYLGTPPDARSAYFDWDLSLAVIPWTEAIYAATYPLAILAPLAAARSSDLRRFALGGLAAMAIIFPLYLLVPLVAEAKPVPGEGIWQVLMRLERLDDGPVTAFPSFHVVWACLAAQLYASRWPRVSWFLWAFAVAQAVSCVTTGMHAAIDVAAGFAVYALVRHGRATWERLRAGCEWLANSWSEVTIGPVRLMNHSLLAGIGAAIGFAIAGALAGRENLPWLVIMMAAVPVGSALWAQVVEGSPQLLRPYGYFGGVFLVSLLAIMAALTGAEQAAWLTFVAFGTGSCFAHAIGRTRCLVQGCCHGSETSDLFGIRYRHPLSRVVRLASLGGMPLHATPLYSMIWMTFVGFALVRLWMIHAPLEFIAGTYFLLVGLGRFVEEHLRGEPQTHVIAGLRLYQWLAIGFVVGGAVLTTLGATPAPDMSPFDAQITYVAIAFGVVYYVAYGVDFPGSNRRFARLR
jgi:protein-S-isoprenylcysteine O-methyltransferase Ste14